MKVTITPYSATLTPETPDEFALMKEWVKGAAPITLLPCAMKDPTEGNLHAVHPVWMNPVTTKNPLKAVIYPEQTKEDNL